MELIVCKFKFDSPPILRVVKVTGSVLQQTRYLLVKGGSRLTVTHTEYVSLIPSIAFNVNKMLIFQLIYCQDCDSLGRGSL